MGGREGLNRDLHKARNFSKGGWFGNYQKTDVYCGSGSMPSPEWTRACSSADLPITDPIIVANGYPDGKAGVTAMMLDHRIGVYPQDDRSVPTMSYRPVSRLPAKSASVVVE